MRVRVCRVELLMGSRQKNIPSTATAFTTKRIQTDAQDWKQVFLGAFQILCKQATAGLPNDQGPIQSLRLHLLACDDPRTTIAVRRRWTALRAFEAHSLRRRRPHGELVKRAAARQAYSDPANDYQTSPLSPLQYEPLHPMSH